MSQTFHRFSAIKFFVHAEMKHFARTVDFRMLKTGACNKLKFFVNKPALYNVVFCLVSVFFATSTQAQTANDSIVEVSPKQKISFGQLEQDSAKGLGGKVKFNTPDTTQINAGQAIATDTTQKPKPEKQKRHSPAKAAVFSAVLPGLGQAYNKKYWKIPIVYAGLGGLGFAVYHTASNFNAYRNAYRLQVDENPLTVGQVNGISDASTLKSYRDYYKRYLDISAICTAVWYTLNIVDAAVDAHLFEWNMRDDLSVSWRPVVQPYGGLQQPQAMAGVSIRLGF